MGKGSRNRESRKTDNALYPVAKDKRGNKAAINLITSLIAVILVIFVVGLIILKQQGFFRKTYDCHEGRG